MKASWKLTSFCHVCLALLTGVMLQEGFNLEPLNSTVLRGSTVRFKATRLTGWTLMIWKLGDVNVLIINSENNTTPSSEQFSATLCSSVDCVEFTIHNVSRQQAGPVSCSLLGNPREKTARLEVQESGTVLIAGGNRTVVQNEQVEFQCQAAAWFPAPNVSWTRNGNQLDSGLYETNSTPHGDSFNSLSILKFNADSSTTVQCLVTIQALATPVSTSVYLEVGPADHDRTVLIAVVSSIGGFALLVLLIILIVFCYKQRKERKPNYKDEMMRARTQSQLSGVEAPGRRRGTVNTSYVSDGHTSETPGDDNTYYRDTREIADTASSSSGGGGGDRVYGDVLDSGFVKHRHLTIV